jgi:hypothetical protein
MPSLLEVLGLKTLAGPVGDATDSDAAGDEDDEVAVAPAPAPSPPPSPASGRGSTAPAPTHGKTPAPASPERQKYDAERAEVMKLRNALGKHPQLAHVKDQTNISDPALGAANAAAARPDWPKAMAELAKARKACVDGKAFADQFATVIARRGEANVLLTAAKESGLGGLAKYAPKLASADDKMKPAKRDFVKATADLDFIVDGLAPRFKKLYVDDVKPQVEALKTLDATTQIVQAEIATIEAMLAQQEAGIAGKQWRRVKLTSKLLDKRLNIATKASSRRAEYDVERPKADTALQAVRAHGAAVAAPVALVEAQLKEADAMASREGMRFEDAKDLVLRIVASCEKFDQVARDAVGYTQERGALAQQLAKLRSHAAADRIGAELDVARAALDAAARAAGDKGAPGTLLLLGVAPAAHDIAGARVRLGQAREVLETAQRLAQGVDGVAAMEKALAGKGDNLPALRKGLESLAKELASAQQGANAELAKVPFDAVAAKLAEAKQKIDARKAEGVAEMLTHAGTRLVEGRRIQIEHSLYLDRVAALQKRVDAHKAIKAQAAKIQSKIDAIAIALFDAAAAEVANDHAGAMARLDAADAAAAAADEALLKRGDFDRKANLVQLDLGQREFAAIKVAQEKELARARNLASAYDFAGALKVVQEIRNAMVRLQTEKVAKADPPDTDLLAEKARELAKAGALDELDALIKNLSPDLDKAVFIALAEARFEGVDFDVEDDGHAQESIQRMCKLMDDLPPDVVRNNPSLKKVTRRVTEKDGSRLKAPFYRSKENLVVMNSRPGKGRKPDFEKGAKGRLPEREESCKPANDKPEVLFDFNMLHELAHSIDDARGYMQANQHKDDHGAWIEIGGDVDRIADAVVKVTGFGKTPEERKYVLDRILRNPAVAPAKFTGDKARFEKFVKAAQTAKVWDQQSLTDDATLDGRVYQEAYPSTWNSYKAEARKRGITSYQFRAPGEWFSELYAAFKVGKLKAGHPSEGWLKKLKV